MIMGKKSNVARPIAMVALAVVAAIAISLIFAGCTTPVTEITENGSYSFGMERVVVNVPTETNNYEYDVQINTSESDYSGETLVETVERIRPAVVDVYASKNNSSSAGSGVIIGAADTDDNTVTVSANDAVNSTAYDQYYIVTNHHVIEGCTNFSVDLLFIGDDDTETHDSYEATLIGSSPGRDIAVLRIDRKADEKIVLADIIADSDKVKVGTEVLAIGNPLGILGGTVTKGIVSAMAREVTVSGIGTMTLMQTDTSINGGNSGGGLFDTNGKLVGVVNSGFETYNGAAVEGLNFAIPANDARTAFTSLIATHTESNGEVTQYGYVAGDTDLDITLSQMSVAESAASAVYTSCVIAVANSITGPLYEEWTNTYNAILTLTVNNGETTNISTLTGANAAIKDIRAGDNVTITYKNLMYTGGGMNRRYYLGSETKTVTVTATQYVYSI